MKGPFLDKTIRLKWHKQPTCFFPLCFSELATWAPCSANISVFLPNTLQKWAASWIADHLVAADPAKINIINSFHFMSLQLLFSYVLEEHIAGTGLHKSHGQLIFFSTDTTTSWWDHLEQWNVVDRYSERPLNNQQSECCRNVDSLRLERPVRSLSPTVENGQLNSWKQFSWTLVHALIHTSGLKLLQQPKVSAYPYGPHVGHLLHLPWRGSASFPSGKGKIWGYPGL